jgi:hypothetical protein
VTCRGVLRRLQRLHEAVRRAENALLARDAEASASPQRQARERESIDKLEERYQARMEQLVRREQQLGEETARWRGEVQAAQARVAALVAQLDEAKLELEVRCSPVVHRSECCRVAVGASVVPARCSFCC